MKRAALFGASLLVVLVLVEIVLAAAGMYPAPSEKVRWSLVGEPGEERVRIHLRKPDDDRLVVEVSPSAPTGTFRTVMVGDSTVHGHLMRPMSTVAEFLEYLLEERTGVEHEVLNLGVAGTVAAHSRRLATLAVRELDPDLVLVYTGHNQFFGKHRARSVYAAEHPRQMAMRRWLAATRVGRGISRATGGEHGSDIPLSVDAGSAALEILPISRTNAARSAIVEDYGQEIQRIIDVCRAEGVPVVFISPFSNGRSYGPFGSAHSRELSAGEREEFCELLLECRAALEQDTPERCAQLIERAREIDPEVADLVHMEALLAWRRGARDEARELCYEAWRYDEYPVASSDTLIAELAGVTEREKVSLLDLGAVLEREEGPGEPAIFYDHVHPAIYGQYLMACEVVERVPEFHREAVAPSSVPTFEQSCQALKIPAEQLRRAENARIMGDVNFACLALSPRPYMLRARARLDVIPEQEIRSSVLLYADFDLAVLESDRERIMRRAREIRDQSPDKFAYQCKAIQGRPRMLAGLRAAGLELEEDGLLRLEP